MTEGSDNPSPESRLTFVIVLQPDQGWDACLR
jgi:hypothetical protein